MFIYINIHICVLYIYIRICTYLIYIYIYIYLYVYVLIYISNKQYSVPICTSIEALWKPHTLWVFQVWLCHCGILEALFHGASRFPMAISGSYNPTMEVLYHIRPYITGICPLHKPYIWQVPPMNPEIVMRFYSQNLDGNNCREPGDLISFWRLVVGGGVSKQ